jgi:hypothetical protein
MRTDEARPWLTTALVLGLRRHSSPARGGASLVPAAVSSCLSSAGAAGEACEWRIPAGISC